MKTLHIDSIGGLAGDMFLAAALDAGLASLDELQAVVSAWLPERVVLGSEEVRRAGMRARTFTVKIAHEDHPHDHHHQHHHPQGHHHRNLADVERLLERCPIPEEARALARTMFRELAAAEAKVHGAPLESVHFHEVGATDSLVDFALASLVLSRVGAPVTASPALLGRGRVAMQHGFWPVPPPGTAELLAAGGVPSRALPPDFPWENAELTTPTGACLLRRAERFGDPPAGTFTAVGMGAGTLDIPGFPNVTRLLLVESAEAPAPPPRRFDADEIAVLETWIDDLPGNLLAEACEALIEGGALDVAVSSATFKKGRVGYRVEVLSPPEKAEALAALVLGRTTTIGLRVRRSERWKLFREEARTADGLAAKLVRDAAGEIARLVPESDAVVERARAEGAPPMFRWRVEKA